MLLIFISAILALVSVVEGYADYDDITDGDTYEYYEGYNGGNETSTTSSYEDSTINRVRRYDLKSSIRTLGPDDVRDVRGALKELLSGIAIENPFTPFTMATYTPTQSSTITSTSTYNTITKSSIMTTSTYDTLSTNTTYSTMTTYLTSLMTEIMQYTNSAPTRSKHLKHKLVELIKMQRQLLTTLSDNITPNNTNTTSTTTTTTTTTTRRPELDIPRLLAIISDLANEFEANLTRKLGEKIRTMSLPTCTTPTSEPPITSEYDANYTGSLIAKCFVCGLEVPRIPRHAHCADAFAGDFLPLVPVDPTAKGKISRYRKYCKYSNVPGYVFNKTEPRALMGRWTGGCSVRWIDLSGIYTQRSCRNRLQPTMGRHFASKRMAKLERTLWNVENGCIISPMATLVPLSRGVSLYARFHACVCTGSWCNFSSVIAPSISFIIAMSTLLCVDVKF